MITSAGIDLRPGTSLSGHAPDLSASPADWREDELVILDLRIGLRSNDPGLADDLRTLFAGGRITTCLGPSGCEDFLVAVDTAQAGQRLYSVVQNGQMKLQTQHRDGVLVYLERSISNALARHLGTSYHLVHGAALARDGCGVLLPGPSGAGKSVIAAALALGGFEYFSDEIAVITGDGRLTPFPKLISLKSDGWRAVAKDFPGVRATDRWARSSDEGLWHLAPVNWPQGPGLSGPKVGVILVPCYKPGGATTVEPMPKTVALVRVVEQSLNLRHLGASAMETLVGLIRNADCFSFNVKQPSEAGPLVTRLIAGRTSAQRL